MALGSLMRAITCNWPPQLGHRLKSTANTRFSRAIQLSGVVHALAAVPSARPALLAGVGRATMLARVHCTTPPGDKLQRSNARCFFSQPLGVVRRYQIES